MLIDGKLYRGTYWVEGNSITVVYAGADKKTWLGASSPEALARIMLRELVENAAGRVGRHLT